MEVFNLNIRPGKTCPVIHCSQFDKGRTFRANLYDGSEVFTLTAAETLSVIEKKSDGNMVTIGVTNTSDSYVEFATTEQMTALAGPQICELRIVEGDTLIGSANFILDCEESPDTGIESESEIHNLTTQIQDINEQIVPDMVAEEVANQYDSQNVIFDDHPTEGHGTGYVVKSENVPDELYDLDDVNIDDTSLERGQALVYNPGTGKWENATIPQTGTIEDVAIASFSDGADNVPLSMLIFDIEARQEGSGTPSPDNVRAISGFDSGLIRVDGDQVSNIYTVDFGQTVYGGFFDNRGNLVVTHGYIASYNGETINEPWISSMDNYVPNTLPSTGAQVVYPLTIPTTLAITSQNVRTLLGNNNIFVNTGNIRRLEYFKTGCENIAKLVEAAPNLSSVQSVNGQTGSVELTADNIPYDSETSIAEKITGIDDDVEANTQAIGEKANKTQIATFSPASDVSVMHISSGYTDKQGCISAEIRFTGSANAWKTLGTLSIKPNDACQVVGINTGTGAPIGIVRLRDTGVLEVYPTSAVSNSVVGFSISFVKA